MQRAGWLRARPWGYAGQADAAKIPSLACDRREGPPGVFDSADGTLGAEWQCDSHCHSVVNVRGGTLRGEWQCSTHCQAASSVPHRNARGRVAVRTERSWPSGSANGTLMAEWQCYSHCHSPVNVLGSAPCTARRHRAYRIGTIGVEWQCVRYAGGRVAV